MCRSREEAVANCKRVYGHDNIAEPDYRENGHYYSAPEDLKWAVEPTDDGDPGVLEVRDGAKPLCVLAAEKGMIATPPVQPMQAPDPAVVARIANAFSWKNALKKPE